VFGAIARDCVMGVPPRSALPRDQATHDSPVTVKNRVSNDFEVPGLFRCDVLSLSVAH
jgi:hypothetical protein